MKNFLPRLSSVCVISLMMVGVGVVSYELPRLTQSAQAQESSEIFSLPDNSEDIEELRELYKDQLVKYRSEEQQRTVAETEFLQLETLAAFDRYVQETRDVISSRDDVLISHLSLQRLTLQQTAGVRVDQKDNLLDLSEQIIGALKEHKTRNEQVTDRDGVLASLSRFSELRPAVSLLSTQMTLGIKMGQMQDAIDRAERLNTTLDETISEAEYLSDSERDKMLRSHSIAVETVAQAQTALDAFRAEIDPRDLEDAKVSDYLKRLDPSYVTMVKAERFQRELIGEISDAR